MPFPSRLPFAVTLIWAPRLPCAWAVFLPPIQVPRMEVTSQRGPVASSRDGTQDAFAW